MNPFRGVRYTRRAGPSEALVAPPYDVISAAEQQRLLDLSPRNVVRLILNPERPGDQSITALASVSQRQFQRR